jgi:hypothetical protein
MAGIEVCAVVVWGMFSMLWLTAEVMTSVAVLLDLGNEPPD